MTRRFVFLGAALCAALASSASAQTFQRKATIKGGGAPDRGKCTVEVVVDKTAEVEVRGDTGILRNIAGQAPQWRRFECTGPLPQNPADFRFAGVDGRGRQELVRDPRNGGAAVVRIDDPDNGSEGYTFDLIWGAQGQQGYRTDNGGPGIPPQQGYPPQDRAQDRGRVDNGGGIPPQDNRANYDNRRYDGERDPRDGGRFTTEQAVRVCQDAVRQQAIDRFRTRDMTFRRTAIEDNPGRRDWVSGLLEVHRRFGGPDLYRFSCSVNFDNGQVRSAQIDRADDRDRR